MYILGARGHNVGVCDFEPLCLPIGIITVAELTVLISAWTPTTTTPTTAPLETDFFYVIWKIVITSFEFSDYITSFEVSDFTLHHSNFQ